MTDNASNFGKLFQTFSISSSFQSILDVGIISLNESISDSENYFLVMDNMEKIDVSELFINLEKHTIDNYFYLPQHLKCCTHT